MKKLFYAGALSVAVLLLIVTALLSWPLPDMPDKGTAGNFLIHNISVIDVGTGTTQERQDVVLLNGKILAISPARALARSEGMITIDGTGKYLVPGLWDMHAHSVKHSPQYTHPMFIANGVTGIRDMSGCMSKQDSFFTCISDRQAWNAALRDGRALSPRYVGQSSFPINGGKEVPDGFPAFFKARSAEESRQLVRFYREAGADFLKVYTELSLGAYRTLADEARRQGLDLAGHRPHQVSLEQALRAGQRSIEHPRLFLQECFRGAERLRELPFALAAAHAELDWKLVNEHDSARCAGLMKQMAQSDTWWTPTLQVLKMEAYAGNQQFRTDARLKYIPYLFNRFVWTPDADRAARQPPDAAGRALYATQYRMALAHIGQAHTAGIKILAGTDAGDTYVFPGFSMHDELEELVRGGLSPAAALRSATLDAARFAGMDEHFGSVTIGKAADLLLLEANPLEDVRHTRRIVGLFFNGRFLDRHALDALLLFTEQQAGSLRFNLQLMRDAVTSPLLRVQAAD